jgi:hypothetical protein
MSEESTPRKRLSEKEWSEIVVLWELGEHSLQDLSERYGITPGAISSGLNRRGAIHGRLAVENAQKIAKESQDDFAVLLQRAKETKDFHYKSASMIGQLAVKKVQQAEKGDISYAQADDEIKVLLNASKVNAEARKERFAVLGLDKDDLVLEDLPELTIQEMSSFEIEQIRAEQDRRAKSGDLDEISVEAVDVE